MSKVKAIAIHLPQFHPFPENDQWWGKGFTEWTNVARSKPLFEGHYQPHLPADLGFYDLRLQETRVAQAEMANEYGIHGFCYYHYWFSGKRLLNRPLDDMIETGTPDFPFMLCWANENWSRRWDGYDKEILIKQEYGEQDDLAHIRFLCSHYFADKRYIRVDDKPFFIIYRHDLFPDIKGTIELWRKEARELGIGELYLGYMQGFGLKDDPIDLGFDCAIEFHPDFWGGMPAKRLPTFWGKVLNKLAIKPALYFRHQIFSYKEYVDKIIANWKKKPNVYPGITPMWDNSARRKIGATIFDESTPQEYERWLKFTLEKYKAEPDANKFIFINAWNEWAEGNHLEPCQKWGRQYLEVTKETLKNG